MLNFETDREELAFHTDHEMKPAANTSNDSDEYAKLQRAIEAQSMRLWWKDVVRK